MTIDDARLAAWMDANELAGAGAPLELSFVSGGSQNEIYEVRRDGLHAARAARRGRGGVPGVCGGLAPRALAAAGPGLAPTRGGGGVEPRRGPRGVRRREHRG